MNREDPMKKIVTNKYFYLAIFVIVYFAVRMPFFSLGWDGADGNGHDTDIFVNHPQKPNYLLIGRIEGSDIYLPAYGHPAPMYEMVARLGDFFNTFVDLKKARNQEIIFGLKLISSLFQLAIFTLVFLTSVKGKKDGDALKKERLLIFGLLLLSIAPMAIYNNNEFQLDSTFGVLMAGLYSALLLAHDRKVLRGKTLAILFFISSFFIGLGKNEWNLLFVLALVSVASYFIVLKYLLKKSENYNEAFGILLISFAGCSIGNLVSYSFEPAHYISGWKLLFSMSQKASILGPSGLKNFVIVSALRLPYIVIHLILLSYCTFYVLNMIGRLSLALILSYLFSFFLFIAFFFSTFAACSRYFAPSFISLVVSSIIVYLTYQNTDDKKTVRAFLIIYGFLFIHTMSFIGDGALKSRMIFGTGSITERPINEECVPLLNVEDVYKNKMDFIHYSMGYQGGSELAQKYNKRVCRDRP